MRQALILVGGRGTRLGTLARDTPKPLMPIAGDKRFLDYLIEDIARHGVEEIILLAGHLAETVEARYAGATIRGARISVVREPEPAGTAGALRYAADRLDDVFLMTNGDSLLDMNYLTLPMALGPTDQGVLALRRVDDAARFGRVEVAGGRVIGFHEKDASFRGSALISGGVYLLRRSVLDLIDTLPASIETDVFPRLAKANTLASVESGGFFIDIGLPETLAQARSELVQQIRRGAAFFDRDGTLNQDDGYTHKPEALIFQPGAIEAIRRCNDAGRFVIVVTNQAGIARGLYDEADMHRFHAHMQKALRAHGAHIDAFYYSPYHGDGTRPGYAITNHPDRKPNPGQLRRACAEWPIDAARSFVVGDNKSDADAATAFGLPSYLVKPGEILNAVKSALAREASSPTSPPSPQAELKRRAQDARAWLFEHALPLWWERGFDRGSGCFHERMQLDGSPLILPRRIRVQARQTIVYARASRLGWPGPWRDAVEAGAKVLLTHALRADGGTRHLLASTGEVADERRDLYDFAFVLFALAEAAQVLEGREDLLKAADSMLVWLEDTWRHPDGGYLEGEIVPVPPRRQNPHMHVFEALLSLYEASGRSAHLDMASKVADLFRDKFFDHAKGAMPEYFDDAWRPEAGESGRIVEPGHLFEWSWLLHRCARAGGHDLSHIAERLRVHGEVYGVDHATGSVYDEVWIEGHTRSRTARLWPHTERLKANVARIERTYDPNAFAAAAQSFDTLTTYFNTPVAGLWMERRTADGQFIDEAAPASSFYHIMFGLSELIRVSETLD